MKIIPDLVDLEEKIFNRTYTIGWLLDSLRTHDETYKTFYGNKPVKYVKCEDVSAGKGFVSVVVQCIITFVDSQAENDTYSTILKIPGFESFTEVQTKCEANEMFTESDKQGVTKIHNFECDFYKNLAPILDVPVPKVYNSVEWVYRKQEGCLHMEDLTLKGKTISYFDNVNLTQVKGFIRHLAHMHKNILSVDEAIWKGKYLPDLNAFNNALMVFNEMGEDFAQKSRFYEQLQPYLNKYNSMLKKIEFFTAIIESSQALKVRPVLVHGDMHSGNIFWSIDSNGDVQNKIAALVDWQLIHEGNPMEDLARFLLFCADGVVRRQAEAFAIDYYLECLTKEFENDSSKIPFTKEVLEEAYNHAFVIQSCFVLGIVPILLSGIDATKNSQKLIEAYRDYGALKALHAYEDFDEIMMSKMKFIFDKFEN